MRSGKVRVVGQQTFLSFYPIVLLSFQGQSECPFFLENFQAYKGPPWFHPFLPFMIHSLTLNTECLLLQFLTFACMTVLFSKRIVSSLRTPTNFNGVVYIWKHPLIHSPNRCGPLMLDPLASHLPYCDEIIMPALIIAFLHGQQTPGKQGHVSLAHSYCLTQHLPSRYH